MNIKNRLIEIFNKYNININDDIADNLNKFNEMMIEYNKIHNLTRITDEEDVIIKHYLDSVIPINLFKNNSNIIDIGCGGGFPSVPLKIVNNSLNITAIDSVNKKINFVNMVKNDLKLDNFEANHTRIEDFAIKNREKYDYAISRAVAPLQTIIEYSAPFIKIGGYIVAYKGSNYEEELNNSKNALKALKCCVKSVEKYYIEELDTYRYVILIEKLEKTPNNYPRKGNKPRIQPL